MKHVLSHVKLLRGFIRGKFVVVVIIDGLGVQ